MSTLPHIAISDRYHQCVAAKSERQKEREYIPIDERRRIVRLCQRIGRECNISLHLDEDSYLYENGRADENVFGEEERYRGSKSMPLEGS